MGGRGASSGANGGAGGSGAKQSFYEREKERIEKEYVKKDGTLSAVGKAELKGLEFNNNRFKGLDWKAASNQYYEVEQYSPNSDNAIIKVDSSSLAQTPYGYAYKTDSDHVVYLKDWQVNQNNYGNYIIANKQYWNEKETKYKDDNQMTYSKDSPHRLNTFEKVQALAKEQSKHGSGTVKWERGGSGKFGKGGKWDSRKR